MCKINPKWIITLNVRAKTIPLLEENIRGNPSGLVSGKDFLNTLQSMKHKRKNKLENIQIQPFALQKECYEINSYELIATDWEKISGKHRSIYELESRMYKELL